MQIFFQGQKTENVTMDISQVITRKRPSGSPPVEEKVEERLVKNVNLFQDDVATKRLRFLDNSFR